MRIFIAVFIMTVLTQQCFAEVINVPEDFETIQAGIDAAEDGDTVLVQPGVYHENVVLRTADITLASLILVTGHTWTIDSTIIDADDEDCGISVELANDAGAIIRGFTVRNGQQFCGGGIDVQHGQPVFEDMVVTECSAEWWGGGIYLTNSSSAEFRRCRIFENDAFWGGGVAVNGATLVMSDCELTSNEAKYDGAGLLESGYRDGSNISLNHVLIADNVAGDSAAAYIMRGTFHADHLTVARNRSLSENGVGMRGYTGGFGLVGLEAENCTITNSIFFENDTAEISVNTGATINYSNIEDGLDSIRVDEDTELIWGDGNIDEDPLFINPDEGDYHLTEDSPCIDAGDPESDSDPDGTRVDMGAYFFNQIPPVVVNPIDDVTVGEDSGVTEIADLDEIFEEPDGEELNFSFRNAPEELNMDIDEDNILFIDPELNFNLPEGVEIAIIAEDPWGGIAEDSFILVITPVPDAPFVGNPIEPDNDSQVEYDDQIRFSWEESFDPDGDVELTYILNLELYESNDDEQPVQTLNFECDTIFFEVMLDSLFEFGNLNYIAEWWVTTISGDDRVDSELHIRFNIQGPLAVNEKDLKIYEFGLYNLFPNPFNSTTTIEYALPFASQVTLNLYNLAGQRIETLVSDRLQAGVHQATLNAGELTSGLYFVKLEGSGHSFTKKIMLVK